MVSLQQIFPFLIIFSAFLALAFAIKCYTCDSAYDEKCNDPFNPESIPSSDCRFSRVPIFLNDLLPEANSTSCMKTVNEVDGLKRIIRGCFFGDMESKIGCQLDLKMSSAKQISCHVCKDDLCNGFSDILL